MYLLQKKFFVIFFYLIFVNYVFEIKSNGQVPNNLSLNVSVLIKFNQLTQRIYNEVLNLECGVTRPRDSELKVDESFEGEFPWNAVIYKSSFKDVTYQCAGSLISQTSVLTSAACISFQTTETNRLVVYLGKHNYIKWSKNVQLRTISSVIIHPDFKFSTLDSDLAIVRLEKKVELTLYVRPICLWESVQRENTNLIGMEGIVPGWNFNSGAYIGEELSFIRMPIVPKDKCSINHRINSSFISTTSLFCGSFKIGFSICKGDDGAGLVYNLNEHWYLTGVISCGIGYQEEVVCDSKHFVAFTDVASFTDWIKHNI